MSKKVFMLATTRCGHCKQAKQFINSKYPDLNEDQFRYFEYDREDLTEEPNLVLSAAKSLGVRGVPFTVLIEDGSVTKAVRGNDPQGINQLLEEVTGT